VKIYKVTNRANGKVYIGQTAQALSKRRKSHERVASDFSKGKITYFIWALREYGTESFSWEVLCECESPEDLNEKERMYIEFFDSSNPDFGYNATDGGSGTKHEREVDIGRALPEGLVVDRTWLQERGFDRPAVDYFIRSGKLEAVAHGVYRKPGPALKWQNVVYSLSELGYRLHVGHLSALAFHGFSH